MATSQHVIKLLDNWYVQTPTGYDGPFDSYDEAVAYMQLSRTVEAARMEFAGLAQN